MDGLTGPLPVSLIRFYGEKKDGSIELNWETASELNSDRYEVERFNEDAFELIGSVAAHGISQEIESYTFLDDNLENIDRHAIYRLKMIGIDGQYEYSKELIIDITNESYAFTVYPSPATDYITISSDESDNRRIDIKILSIDGTLIKELSNISSNKKIDLSGVREGTYFLSFYKTNQLVETRKFLITR